MAFFFSRAIFTFFFVGAMYFVISVNTYDVPGMYDDNCGVV